MDYSMTVEQIAATLRMTPRGVEMALARALRKIAPLLDAWRGHEPSADTGARITLRR